VVDNGEESADGSEDTDGPDDRDYSMILTKASLSTLIYVQNESLIFDDSSIDQVK
jgi:hypothetical protein